VAISWATAMELNNNYFNVERSNDGINWVSINEVIGVGSSSTTITYNIMDHSPLQGVSYCRLKQTDFDGTYTYSKINVIRTEVKRF
jgi:hypothetical protein